MQSIASLRPETRGPELLSCWSVAMWIEERAEEVKLHLVVLIMKGLDGVFFVLCKSL